jgi:hypothetical protein
MDNLFSPMTEMNDAWQYVSTVKNLHSTWMIYPYHSDLLAQEVHPLGCQQLYVLE